MSRTILLQTRHTRPQRLITHRRMIRPDGKDILPARTLQLERVFDVVEGLSDLFGEVGGAFVGASVPAACGLGEGKRLVGMG